MLFLVVVAIMFAYAPAAVWMLDRRGVPKLWLLFIVGIVSLAALGAVLAVVYKVPHPVRLVLYVCALAWPSFLCTTVFLHVAQERRWGQGLRTISGVGGGVVGMVMGFFLAVYGLRSW